MVATAEYTPLSARRLLCFLTCLAGGMAALVFYLHLARSGSFELRQVQLVESHWAEKTITHRSTPRRFTVLSVGLLDHGQRLNVEIGDMERARAFLDTQRPGNEVPLWVSADGSQLHRPSVFDLAPYALGLSIAAVPIAILSALLAFRPGLRQRTSPGQR